MIGSATITAFSKVLLCCTLALMSALVVIRYRTRVEAPEQLDVQSLLKADGFNFDVILNSKDWNGPRVGESIDTSKMHMRSGQSLTDVIKRQELSMLIVVDPACATCTRSIGYMRQVRDQMLKQHIPYYVAGFINSPQPNSFYEYADFLKLDSPSFRWDRQSETVPIRLEKMIVPTHLLIDKRQVIRGLWPGGGQNELFTGKMLQQITTDVTNTAAASQQ